MSQVDSWGKSIPGRGLKFQEHQGSHSEIEQRAPRAVELPQKVVT